MAEWDVAPALQERLGSEATAGLLALFGTARQEWTVDVATAAVERFEHRLTDEMSGMRVALAQTEAALRQQIIEGDSKLRQEVSAHTATLRKEMGDQGVALRREISDQGVALRQEMSTLATALRKEISGQGVALRQEMGALGATLGKDISDQGVTLVHEISRLRQDHLASRFELVKWSFAFWVGQVVAVAGLVGLMLRLTIGSSG